MLQPWIYAVDTSCNNIHNYRPSSVKATTVNLFVANKRCNSDIWKTEELCVWCTTVLNISLSQWCLNWVIWCYMVYTFSSHGTDSHRETKTDFFTSEIEDNFLSNMTQQNDSYQKRQDSLLMQQHASFKPPVIPGCQNDLHKDDPWSRSSLSTEYTCSGVGMGDYLPISTLACYQSIRREIQVHLSKLPLLQSWIIKCRLCGFCAFGYFPASLWVLEDSVGRVCSRKCALTEGGGDSLPIRGVFSHRGFWKFAFWLLHYRIRGYCMWSPCHWCSVVDRWLICGLLVVKTMWLPLSLKWPQ